ncbi:MAG TPA: LuxR C-terminal-related transcriptional regulator [Chthoniobacterales bacterium]|nr:LuxR C-terminal-related transcriptional regulator [Chthoniobacterales bacterium]
MPDVEILMFSGTSSHHILAEIFRSNVRGCLLKIEAAEELIPALESLRHHHTFRSRRITELHEKITATNGEIASLTAREIETLRLLADGKSSKELATALGISIKTVDTPPEQSYAETKTPFRRRAGPLCSPARPGRFVAAKKYLPSIGKFLPVIWNSGLLAANAPPDSPREPVRPTALHPGRNAHPQRRFAWS